MPGISVTVVYGCPDSVGRGLLFLGWIMGITGSAVGLSLSLTADLLVGATVVSVLGVVPILAALFKHTVTRKRY